ncbi:MAG TPA: flagellar basal body protein [Gaiellaceae bacterium]|jgi:flagellar basal body rod protein FlgG
MDALGDAISGLRAAQLQLDVAAGNVANLNTPGFQPQDVALSSRADGGVSGTVVPGQAPPTIPGLPAGQQPSGTDLIEEMATLVSAPISYDANARVVDATAATTRSLFEAFA